MLEIVCPLDIRLDGTWSFADAVHARSEMADARTTEAHLPLRDMDVGLVAFIYLFGFLVLFCLTI